MSPGLTIELKDIQGFLRTNEPPVLRIEQAHLKVQWVSLLRGDLWPVSRLVVVAPDLRFIATTNRGWQPLPWLHQALGPVLRLPGVGTQSVAMAATEWMRTRALELEVRDGRLRWETGAADEPPVALLEGVDLVSQPIRPESESFQWFTLHIGRAETEEVEWMRDARTVWIRMADRDVVVATNGMRLEAEQWTWQHTLLHRAE